MKEEPETADDNLGHGPDMEEFQDKVKTQGVFKVEDEEQDLKVCQERIMYLGISFANLVFLTHNDHSFSYH